MSTPALPPVGHSHDHHSHGSGQDGHGPVAWVDGEELGRSDVEDVLARMRRGPAAGLLPRDGGSEGRQLRRWLVQLMTTERIITTWGNAHEVVPTVDDERRWRPDPTASLELGSVASAVLTSAPIARAVFRAVTGEAAAAVAADEDRLRDYYSRNQPDFTVAERRRARRRLDGRWRDLGWLRTDQVGGELGRALALAEVGVPTRPVRGPDGWQVLVVDEIRPRHTTSYADARDSIVDILTGSARRHAFVAWLESQRKARVRLAGGYEHPGDPSQPDNTHRH